MEPGTTKLIDVLKCPSLPSLPTVAVQMLELTSDPDVSMKDIANLVSTDQALSGKVLKTVNSSYYGLATSCGSIERALAYLGLNTVKSLVLGFSLVETTALAGENGFDLMGHWRRAIMGATGARAIAKQLRLSDPDEVFTAALFQDMGMLAAFTVLKEDYENVIADIPHRVVSAAEKDAYGFDHSEAGEALAEMWKLPKEISFAIRYHHDPDAAEGRDLGMVQAVSLGALIADSMCSKSAKVAIRRVESQAAKWFGSKNTLEIESLLEEVAESSKTLAKMFDQDIGEIPNPAQLLAQAQEKGLELQINAQQQADKLAHETVTDGLTKIANRKRFDAEMSALFSEVLSGSRTMSVLFFDADKFKLVNDTYGHAAGDKVLVELAKRATDVVGNDGLVCRYGGEEFVVVLPDKTTDQAGVIAENIRASVAGTMFDTSGIDGVPDELAVTVSVGVSGTTAGPIDRFETPANMVTEADDAVYAAKDAGRNIVMIWSPTGCTSFGSRSGAESDGPLETLDAQPTLHKIDASMNGETILLIEDDALAATLIMSLLKRRGSSDLKIEWIRTGDEAQSRIEEIADSKQNPYGVVICDLDLPGSHGLEVLSSLRGVNALSGLPFFILTAHGGHADKRRAVELGVTEFVGKNEFCRDMTKWMDRMVEIGAVPAKAA